MTKKANKEVSTRSVLANSVKKEFQITRFFADEIVEDIIDEIVNSLIRGDKVKLARFGVFFVKQKKERMGRNPKTLEDVVITARKVLLFKASPALKKVLNDK